MSTELIALSCATVLGLLQLFATAAAVTKFRGTKWNLSSRDEPGAPLKGKTARLDRAFHNFKETYSFFAAAILIVFITGKTGALSEACALIYLGARIVYIPLYVLDVVVIRTAVWGLSALAIIGIFAQLAF